MSADGRTPDLSKIESVAFGAPPPGADLTPADSSPAAIAPTTEQLRIARANEQELEPLTFRDSIRPVGPAGQVPLPVRPPMIGETVQSTGVILGPDGQPATQTTELLRLVDPLPVLTPSVTVAPAPTATSRQSRWAKAIAANSPAPAVSEPAAEEPAAAPETPRILTESDLAAAARALHDRDGRPSVYRPAESDTDSPSRGQPRAILDQGKQITGGFGDVGEGQYFPLDGSELRELANGLLSQIHERLKDDLRFTMAVTYPRAKVRVELTVEAYGMANPMIIPAVAKPHDKTPIEIARQRSDEIVFVVAAERAEMSPDGESLHPPNETRRDLGLEVPYKRPIGMGVGRIMVDRES